MNRLVLLAMFLLPILAAGCGGDGQALNPDWPEPTVQPSDDPTAEPTVEPTEEPTEEPTVGPTEEPTGEVVLKELEIPQELASPTVVLGNKLQLAVNGIYSDGTTKDLTTEVAWSSEDSSIASVEEATGLVSALALGVTDNYHRHRFHRKNQHQRSRYCCRFYLPKTGSVEEGRRFRGGNGRGQRIGNIYS